MTKYYCNRCKKYHYRGKIYQNHLKFRINKDKKKEFKDFTYNNELDFDSLRPIAKRQILGLIRKMKLSKKSEFYKKQIKRVIFHENKNI